MLVPDPLPARATATLDATVRALIVHDVLDGGRHVLEASGLTVRATVDRGAGTLRLDAFPDVEDEVETAVGSVRAVVSIRGTPEGTYDDATGHIEIEVPLHLDAKSFLARDSDAVLTLSSRGRRRRARPRRGGRPVRRRRLGGPPDRPGHVRGREPRWGRAVARPRHDRLGRRRRLVTAPPGACLPGGVGWPGQGSPPGHGEPWPYKCPRDRGRGGAPLCPPHRRRGRRGAPNAPPKRRSRPEVSPFPVPYRLNDSPQAHVRVAWGLSKWKPLPSSPSVKSSVVPST